MTPTRIWAKRRKKQIEARVSFLAFTLMCLLSGYIFLSSWITDVQATNIDAIDERIGEENLRLIEEISGQYGICPEFVEAIIWTESSGRVDVVSEGGCIGLMQINPKAQADRMDALGATDLTDARTNITVGCDYLAELFGEYGDAAVVLAAYNTGEYSNATNNAIDGAIGPYAKKVLERAEALERHHGK